MASQEALRLAEPHTQPETERVERERELREACARATGRPVTLRWTQNRSIWISVRGSAHGIRIGLHEALRTADAAVWSDLRRRVLGDREAGAAVKLYLGSLLGAASDGASDGAPDSVSHGASNSGSHRASHRASGATPRLRRTQGDYHDLAVLFDEVNRDFFHGASRATITWGHASGRRRRRSIQLGCYVAELGLIRIHPALDQVFVPRFFVAWVIFHELLHEVLGVENVNGRRQVHPPEFAALEASHPDHHRAKAWERTHLDRLLRYRPRRA